MRFLLAVLAAAALLAGCGSDKPAATPARVASPPSASDVTVTIGAGALHSTLARVSASKPLKVHLRSTQAQPADVTLRLNGTLIGHVPHVKVGDRFSVIIPRLQPGKLVVKAGSRRLRISVA
jgi:hypothetical protein